MITDSVTPSNACANIFFAGNDLTTNSNQDNLLASPNIQNVGRTTSSFWQYPASGPLDSVLQMPLPSAGFQYARDANRGQLLLFPANPGLGMYSYFMLIRFLIKRPFSFDFICEV